jgi:hypothetical protein
MDVLRRLIMCGVQDVQHGRFTTCATDSELETLTDQIITRGREKPIREYLTRGTAGTKGFLLHAALPPRCAERLRLSGWYSFEFLREPAPRAVRRAASAQV